MCIYIYIHIYIYIYTERDQGELAGDAEDCEGFSSLKGKGVVAVIALYVTCVEGTKIV